MPHATPVISRRYSWFGVFNRPGTWHPWRAGIAGPPLNRMSVWHSADSLGSNRSTLANTRREASPCRCVCGIVGIASELQVHAPTRGRPLISVSALHHIHRTRATCGIPSYVLRLPSMDLCHRRSQAMQAGKTAVRLNSFSTPMLKQ